LAVVRIAFKHRPNLPTPPNGLEDRVFLLYDSLFRRATRHVRSDGVVAVWPATHPLPITLMVQHQPRSLDNLAVPFPSSPFFSIFCPSHKPPTRHLGSHLSRFPISLTAAFTFQLISHFTPLTFPPLIRLSHRHKSDRYFVNPRPSIAYASFVHQSTAGVGITSKLCHWDTKDAFLAQRPVHATRRSTSYPFRSNLSKVHADPQSCPHIFSQPTQDPLLHLPATVDRTLLPA
jgi:hypothetical protein